MPRSSLALAALAALMGAAGVGLAALAAHASGGDLGRTAALFLLLHAAALIGVAAHARTAPALIVAGFALAAGASLFAADLAHSAFLGGRLFPFAAPLGGSTMILAWAALAILFAGAAMRR